MGTLTGLDGSNPGESTNTCSVVNALRSTPWNSIRLKSVSGASSDWAISHI